MSRGFWPLYSCAIFGNGFCGLTLIKMNDKAEDYYKEEKLIYSYNNVRKEKVIECANCDV
jgi:hypothetical protein